MENPLLGGLTPTSTSTTSSTNITTSSATTSSSTRSSPCPCCSTRRQCWSVALAAVFLAVVVLVVAYTQSFWLTPPSVSIDLASVRLVAMSLSMSPPTWNTDVNFNLTLSNSLSVAVDLAAATADMFYLDGAQTVAHMANPKQAPPPAEYFLASGITAPGVVHLPASSPGSAVPVQVKAVNSFVQDTKVLSLAVRDCAVLPSGSGLYLRFYVTGQVSVSILPTLTVPRFQVDVYLAPPPCVR
jgi:hypothetical protein